MFLDRIFGRLGNRMFQMAALYKYANMNNVDVYFQDPKWFEGYEEKIKQLFGEGIKNDNRIAIHVRRGDYVNNAFYVDLTKTGYYTDAINLFPFEKFLIFSDDIEWCKSFFSGINADYSEGHTPEEDLKLMAGCKGLIMANSSLSWWGAFLGPTKQVIYPKEWFSDKIGRVGFLKEWRAL